MNYTKMIKITLIGLAAGLCISAQGNFSVKKEKSSSRTMKKKSKVAQEEPRYRSYEQDEYVPTIADIEHKKKSAASKVLAGE